MYIYVFPAGVKAQKLYVSQISVTLLVYPEWNDMINDEPRSLEF